MSAIRLRAPLAGWATPLDEVPDPVFAERMLGDGIAIDPLERRRRARRATGWSARSRRPRHAVTLQLANGAELLIHVGLDTVALGGEGFTAHVARGERVAAGDALIEFDLDAVAQRAKSLITPIVVTKRGFRVITAWRWTGQVAAGEPICSSRAATGVAAAATADGGRDTARCDRSPARPRPPRPARRRGSPRRSSAFAAEVALVGARPQRQRAEPGRAAALGAAARRRDRGDRGRGADAEPRSTPLAELIESGMGEGDAPVAAPVAPPAAARLPTA